LILCGCKDYQKLQRKHKPKVEETRKSIGGALKSQNPWFYLKRQIFFSLYHFGTFTTSMNKNEIENFDDKFLDSFVLITTTYFFPFCPHHNKLVRERLPNYILRLAMIKLLKWCELLLLIQW